MSDIVLVIHQQDLPYAQTLEVQRGAQIMVVDPAVYGYALSLGFRNLSLACPDKVDVTHDAIRKAELATLAISHDIGKVLGLLIPEAAIVGWATHRMYHSFWTSLAYRQIGHKIVSQYPDSHWHILLPHNPYCFGVHSFLPGLAVIEQLQLQGVKHTAYGINAPGMGDLLLPDLRKVSVNTELLCHLPTCFSDADYIVQELRVSGLTLGILTPQFYDIPMGDLETSGLCSLSEVRAQINADDLLAINGLEEAVKVVIRQHLLVFMTQPGYLETQVNAFWEIIEAHCLLFFWLEKCFGLHPPKQMLLSNHDATIHGALMAFAERHRISVILVPHAKVFNHYLLLTHGQFPLCLHHGLQDGPCVDIAGRVMPSGRLRYPGMWLQDLADSPKLETIGIILNALSFGGYVEEYIAGLKSIQNWAKSNNVGLRWRVRPKETPLLLIADRLALSAEQLSIDEQGSVLEFGRGCDICIGYDQPTSGLHDLLREGIAVIQAEVRHLARAEWSIVDSQVAPRVAVPELLERLNLMHKNPDFFQSYRHKQYQAAIASQHGAQVMQYWLKNC